MFRRLLIVLVCLCLLSLVWACPEGGVGPDEPSPTDAAPADTLSIDTSLGEPRLTEPSPELPADPNPLANIATPELLKDGLLFPEGPVWDAANNQIYFCDLIGNQIYRLELTDPPALKSVRKPSELANGMGLDAKGQLVVAERGKRRLTITQSDGTVVPLVEAFEGKKLNGPNDLSIHSNGAVYFTDPSYALSDAAREIPFNGVFRVSADGKDMAALWQGDTETRPNGIILSPDEQRLYFVDAAKDTIWVAPLKADGTIDTPTVLSKETQAPDGVAMDVQENLYVAAKEGVEVFSKEGKKWGTIKFPAQPANLTFIGKERKTLLVAVRGALYQIKGMPFAGSH